MTDIRFEKLIAFAEACKMLPGKVALSTLHRWRLRGIRGVKLETVKIGGRRYVSAAALARFAQQTSEAADGSAASAQLQEKRADASKRAASQYLDDEGV